MWLLDTSTLELHEFVGSDIPGYAILSHTWGADEVSFRDMRKDREAARQKSGFTKVEKCCQKARRDGHNYAWIDTCCIDKRSSAELSEAINTMFHWYEEARVCYAYLADVPSEDFNPTYVGIDDAFSKSRWFTRGWTLQELIAPKNIQFLGHDWRVIGLKVPPGTYHNEDTVIKRQNEIFLSKLARITGTDEAVLFEPSMVRLTPAAQKMAWAAKRETSREEDLAYALMGLFGVSMPILYGEGLKKAFRRLQLEIIQMTTDQSIFVWRGTRSSSGLLAESPRDFADSGLDFVWRSPTLQPYSMTNVGLLVKLPVVTRPDGSSFVALRCWVKAGTQPKRIVLPLHRISRPDGVEHGASEGEIYRRRNCDTFELTDWPDGTIVQRDIYVMEDEQFHHLLWIDDDTGVASRVLFSKD